MSKTQPDTTRTAAKRSLLQNGFAIRDFRIKEGLTRVALGDIVGIHPDALANIENETKSSTPATLNRIARALGIRVGSIMRQPASVPDDDEEPVRELVA